MTETDPIFEDLLALRGMSDDEIDASDIPIRTDFSGGREGRFFHLSARDYDVRAIANWCIRRAKSEGRKITNLWLNKMVFFIYEEALKTSHVLLTSAKAEAWDHGPVFREIYFGFKAEDVDGFLKTFDPVRKRKIIAEERFEHGDVALFESVWLRLAKMSGAQLRNLSHKEGQAWYRVWNYTGQTNPGMQIDIATIIGAENKQ